MSSKWLAATMAIAAAGACFGAGIAVAALPPPYARWNEIAAVVGDDSIAHKLFPHGPVDSIEWIGPGTYRVRAGSCFLDVVLTIGSPKDEQGRAMVGGAVVERVDVGEVACE